MGRVQYGPTSQESTEARRSLYVVQDIHAGDMLTRENMRSIRPGKGLSPEFYEVLLGKKINKDASKGTPLGWDLIG